MGPISVVIATYNRPVLVERLLRQLAAQSLSGRSFEVVVVDDGSSPPVAPRLNALELPFRLKVVEQKNAGAAAARNAGAESASGDLLVFVDDDMQVSPDFLQEHLTPHLGGERVVVLGRIKGDPALASMPLFERWHQRLLDRLANEIRTGAAAPQGSLLYSGNFSVRRCDFLDVGGFDTRLGHAEDTELGMRLEFAGVRFLFSEQASTLHGSDHTSLEKWRLRAGKYGRFDLRISRKHPRLRDASPWHYLYELNPVTLPLLLTALADPDRAGRLATGVMKTALTLDRVGLERPALAGTTVAYAIEYFRGARTEAGTLGACLDELLRYTGRFEKGPASVWSQWYADVREDQAVMRGYEEKYGHPTPSSNALFSDLIQKIGLQTMAAYRLMAALRDAGHMLAAKVMSRSIRHLYGADIHWEARFEPGVMIVHGMGMAISHAAQVERGATLYHGVTLGMGTDPATGRTGAPRIGRNVAVGPGATLIGPITIGEGTKIMPGVVLTESVPPGSVVVVPPPTARPRVRAAG
ncbi:MAG: exopolysaccharide biosynthesis glycosyltransferase EpsD [Myxococcaceae bacterium]